MAALRVPVLMYHRIAERVPSHERGLCVEARQFADHLAWLHDNGYTPCSVRDFAAWTGAARPLPDRSVLITFDDGYAGLHEHALPLLAQRGWPATVFLVSALVGKQDAWRLQGPADAAAGHSLLGPQHIREMVRHGMEFQSHSRTHPDLTTLDDDELRVEIHGARSELEDLLGASVEYFAYPFGRHTDRVRSAVRAAGYQLGFSVEPGFNRPGQDPWTVRRLDVTGTAGRARFSRMVSLGSNDGSLLQKIRYLGRQAVARMAPRA